MRTIRIIYLTACFFMPMVLGCDQSKIASVGHACELLTKNDVETVIGTEVAEPPRFESNSRKLAITNCSYSSRNGKVGLQVVVPPDGETTGARDRAFLIMQREMGAMHKLEKVDGFMDGAIWDSQGNFTVFSGKDFVILSFTKSNEPAPRQVVETLMKRIVQRLE